MALDDDHMMMIIKYQQDDTKAFNHDGIFTGWHGCLTARWSGHHWPTEVDLHRGLQVNPAYIENQERVLESKCRCCDIPHITHQVPIVL